MKIGLTGLKPVTALAAASGLALVAPLFAAAPPASGDQLFRQRCAACHSLSGTASGVGPNLRGVIGRKAGKMSGYQYSPAMAKSTMVWTRPTLDKYLANPAAIFPGTKMTVKLSDAQQRAAVIQLLANSK